MARDLLGALAAMIGGGLQGYGQGKVRQQEMEEDRKQREFTRQLQERQLQLQELANQRDVEATERRNRLEDEARERTLTSGLINAKGADENLSPEEAVKARELRIPTRSIAGTVAPKVGESMTLPSVGGAAPMQVGVPTYGMGTAPQTRRAFNPQEQAAQFAEDVAMKEIQRAVAEAERAGAPPEMIAALRTLGPRLAPQGVAGFRTAEQRDAEAEKELQRKLAEIREQNAGRQIIGPPSLRPVVSSVAPRIAELATSLDDIVALSQVLSGPDSTGTWPKVGAVLPNWITDFTGLGEPAKQRQATIDRVKQVIGKTLEGGVLRKEDELKYTKILPTIYDTSDVVQTKLVGLDQAIRAKYTNELDALEDAGYDVTQFRERFAQRPQLTTERVYTDAELKPYTDNGYSRDEAIAFLKSKGGR